MPAPVKDGEWTEEKQFKAANEILPQPALKTVSRPRFGQAARSSQKNRIRLVRRTAQLSRRARFPQKCKTSAGWRIPHETIFEANAVVLKQSLGTNPVV
jgi:hypothetical protein